VTTPSRPGKRDPLGMLGLARKAGAVIFGVENVRRAILHGDARLVVLASDAADGQLMKVQRLLQHHDVPIRWATDRAALGRAVGSSPLTVVAVSGPSFAESLERGLPDRRGSSRPVQEENGV
jgi:ribosomal protein L7Ae-like RNA K-turn-binding protein